jgi:hypothetical protein
MKGRNPVVSVHTGATDSTGRERTLIDVVDWSIKPKAWRTLGVYDTRTDVDAVVCVGIVTRHRMDNNGRNDLINVEDFIAL